MLIRGRAMNKYRIKHVPARGYFAQVKRGVFCQWETIGKNDSGFGEFPKDECYFPLNDHHSAIKLVQDYAEFKGAKYGFVTYTDIDL